MRADPGCRQRCQEHAQLRRHLLDGLRLLQLLLLCACWVASGALRCCLLAQAGVGLAGLRARLQSADHLLSLCCLSSSRQTPRLTDQQISDIRIHAAFDARAHRRSSLTGADSGLLRCSVCLLLNSRGAPRLCERRQLAKEPLQVRLLLRAAGPNVEESAPRHCRC